MLTQGCLASGRDFNDRGATYDYHESMPMGIPNVADSFAAIDRLVFAESRLTLAELVQHMKRDYPHEAIRQALLHHAPKYGNDDDTVDGLAAYVLSHYCELVRKLSEMYQIPFFVQPFTFLWLVDAGQRTAASPDGRRRGENLAYSISPMQGRDFKGLTALINSLAKLPQHLAAGSTSAIVEAEPVLFCPENVEHRAAIGAEAAQLPLVAC